MDPYYTSALPSSYDFKPRDHSLFWILMIVVAMHASLILNGWVWSFPSPRPAHNQKIMVKTVQLKPALRPLAEPQTSPISQPLKTSSERAAPPLPAEVKEPIQNLAIDKVEEKSLATPLKSEEATPMKSAILSTPKLEAKALEPKKEANQPVKKTITPSSNDSKTPPKAKPANDKQPKPDVKKNTSAKTDTQAPVKKTVDKDKIAKVEKKDDAKAIQAAKEAEKKQQQELAVQEAARIKQKELLAQAQSTLAKVEQSRGKLQTSKSSLANSWGDSTMPQVIGSLQIDALPIGTSIGNDLTSGEVSYSQEVIGRLKKALKFPDYGTVDVKVTLDRSGKVLAIHVVNSESEKNRQYVESKLSSVIFSPFGNHFTGLSQYTFFIKLKNQ